MTNKLPEQVSATLVPDEVILFADLSPEESAVINGGWFGKSWGKKIKKGFKKAGRAIKKGFKWSYFSKAGDRVSKLGLWGAIFGGALQATGLLGQAIDGDEHTFRG